MATLSPNATPTTGHDEDRPSWMRSLAWITGMVAVTDLVFLILIREVVPPIAAGLLLTSVGLALLRRWPRAGIITLGVVSLGLLIGFLPFAASHLTHPESGIDFTHAVVAILGRLLAAVAAVGALRRASMAGARRLSVAAIGLAALTVCAAGIGTVASPGDDARDGDIEVVVNGSAFPETVRVAADETLFVDNRDLFRHTFTVTGTDLDVELPTRQGVRVPVALLPGTYEIICDIPGHEFMAATLEVD